MYYWVNIWIIFYARDSWLAGFAGRSFAFCWLLLWMLAVMWTSWVQSYDGSQTQMSSVGPTKAPTCVWKPIWNIRSSTFLQCYNHMLILWGKCHIKLAVFETLGELGLPMNCKSHLSLQLFVSSFDSREYKFIFSCLKVHMQLFPCFVLF